LEDNDGLLYRTYDLDVYDDLNSDVLILNTTPLNSADKVISAKAQKTGAYTAIVTAVGSLHGAAKKNAVETACMTTGIFGTGLTGT
jgi:hypothetical protein